MLYLHCVSEVKKWCQVEWFYLCILKCRETHVSYIECLSVRRRCVIPDVVESRSVDVYVSHAGSNQLFLRSTKVLKEKWFKSEIRFCAIAFKCNDHHNCHLRAHLIKPFHHRSAWIHTCVNKFSHDLSSGQWSHCETTTFWIIKIWVIFSESLMNKYQKLNTKWGSIDRNKSLDR